MLALAKLAGRRRSDQLLMRDATYMREDADD